MLVVVLPQRREGRFIPRHTMRVAEACLRGELCVADARDPLMHRTSRVARLLDPERPTVDLLPPLKDATLLYVDHARIVITGFEEVLERDFAQTWMIALEEEDLHATSPVRRR